MMNAEILIVLVVVAIAIIVTAIRRHLASGKLLFPVSLGQMPLDPSKRYRYELVATFPDEKSAGACMFEIASLSVPATAEGYPSGRWNVDLTYVGKGDLERFTEVSAKFVSAAEKHGGTLGISSVGYA